MSFDIAPLELLVAALTAVLFALTLSFSLAAAAIAGPRGTWNRAGLAMGLGLLVGVILAGVQVLAGIDGPLLLLATLALLLGLICALVAAVLVVVLADGSAASSALGVVACGLIGLGEPLHVVPAQSGFSSSVLVVLAGVVVEAVALVVIVGALVAAARRARALQIGIASAGAVGALLLGVGEVLLFAHGAFDLPASGVPLGVLLIALVVALALGGIGGAVQQTVRARRRSRPVARA